MVILQKTIVSLRNAREHRLPEMVFQDIVLPHLLLERLQFFPEIGEDCLDKGRAAALMGRLAEDALDGSLHGKQDLFPFDRQFLIHPDQPVTRQARDRVDRAFHETLDIGRQVIIVEPAFQGETGKVVHWMDGAVRDEIVQDILVEIILVLQLCLIEFIGPEAVVFKQLDLVGERLFAPLLLEGSEETVADQGRLLVILEHRIIVQAADTHREIEIVIDMGSVNEGMDVVTGIIEVHEALEDIIDQIDSLQPAVDFLGTVLGILEEHDFVIPRGMLDPVLYMEFPQTTQNMLPFVEGQRIHVVGNEQHSNDVEPDVDMIRDNDRFQLLDDGGGGGE